MVSRSSLRMACPSSYWELSSGTSVGAPPVVRFMTKMSRAGSRDGPVEVRYRPSAVTLCKRSETVELAAGTSAGGPKFADKLERLAT
jgi:hypothetical protein